MAKYVYPAVFHKNEDGSFTVSYPDLPGCISEGKNLGNAMHMAQRALTQWIGYLNDKKTDIPVPSRMEDIQLDNSEFTNYICAEVKDERAVRRTISLPKWMDELASAKGLSLSKILQDALTSRLDL